MAKAAFHAARLAEFHPYTWKLAWEAVYYMPFLLPHDKSYLAIRHFIAVKPRGLFLDIGANDGISALSFRRFSKDYNILSLEPNPLLEGSLKRLRSRDPNFEYRMIGAGVNEARGQFFVPVYNGIVLHTFAGASSDAVRAAVELNFGKSVARRIRMETFEANIIPGDQLNVRPTIIKIDAEGFDLQILHGLRNTIRSALPFIVIEAAEEDTVEIFRFFDDFDYALFDYDLTADQFCYKPRRTATIGPVASGHRNSFAIPRRLLDRFPVQITDAKGNEINEPEQVPNSVVRSVET
jgi:FkbM family methyltransferase